MKIMQLPLLYCLILWENLVFSWVALVIKILEPLVYVTLDASIGSFMTFFLSPNQSKWDWLGASIGVVMPVAPLQPYHRPAALQLKGIKETCGTGGNEAHVYNDWLTAGS